MDVHDTHYMNEINSDFPIPIKPWKRASSFQIQSYLNNINTEQKAQIDAAYICSTSIGFYLV